MKWYLYYYCKQLLVINKKSYVNIVDYNYEGAWRVMPPLNYLFSEN